MSPPWAKGRQYPSGPGPAQANFHSDPEGRSLMNSSWQQGWQHPYGPAPAQTDFSSGPVGGSQMNPSWETGWRYACGPGPAQTNFHSGPTGSNLTNPSWEQGWQYPYGPGPAQTNFHSGPTGSNLTNPSWEQGWHYPYGPGPAHANLQSGPEGRNQMNPYWNGWQYPGRPGPAQANFHSNPQGRSQMNPSWNGWQHPSGPRPAQANPSSGRAPMSHTASHTWLSDEAKERDKFFRVQANIPFVAPQSPFVPRTLDAWVDHRVRRLDDKIAEERRHIEVKTATAQGESKTRVMPAFGGKQFNDFRSPVLALESIWRPGEETTPARPLAPWPDASERRHEGNLRSRSGYNRFLPLPRLPGNGTMTWKQRAHKLPFEFDAVGLPKLNPEEMAVETDEDMYFFVGNDLLRKLDR